MIMMINAKKAVFMLCDLQERFMPRLTESARLVGACQRLVEAAGILSIPVIITEQNPSSTYNLS